MTAATDDFAVPGLHAGLTVQRLAVGREQAPLLVVDNLVADPDGLREQAARAEFAPIGRFFPGIRAAAPAAYQAFIVRELAPLILEHFGLAGRTLAFSMCHFSIVTTPPARLHAVQRIPHFDSVDEQGLATIHYLFRRAYGGTAFYRHRKTGFETIDAGRRADYFRSLEAENGGPDMPPAAYIDGDTALFEQVARQDGVFNRLLVYRRNALHSGCIGADFVPDANPLTGRLSINSFLDPAN